MPCVTPLLMIEGQHWVCCNRYALLEEDVLCQVQHALKLVGMEAFQNRPTHTLSGGQKQRVAIAGALAECPKVLSWHDVLPACTASLPDDHTC